MKTKHITKILDRSNFSKLSAEDLANIEKHAANCQICSQALRAARISSTLLQTEVSVPVSNGFFQAKVLNAWREKQNIQKPSAGFRRWWQASAALVCSMLLAVGGLISVSFLMSDSNSTVRQAAAAASNYNLYSADSIILNQKMPKDLTTEQAFEVLENSKLNQQRK